MSGTSGTQDGWLVRLDGGGEFLWQNFYGALGEDFASSIVPLQSGGFVFCGGKSIGSDMNAWLVSVDGTGQTIWDSLYGGDSLDFAADLVETSDGGFSVIGSTKSFSVWSEAYHFKVDGDGGLMWEWNWGQINNQEGFELVELADGRFASAHGTKTSGAGGEDMFILLSYPDGGFQTGTTFGGPEDDFGYSIAEVSDGGFILAGATRSYGSGPQDAFLVKTGSDGLTTTQDVFSEF
ncbi:MAG: hypothetical protein IPO17_17640, partial [Flavobacteriales bacterium]|nr:hypothetical protein [Flavobacteriales bacterium]